VNCYYDGLGVQIEFRERQLLLNPTERNAYLLSNLYSLRWLVARGLA